MNEGYEILGWIVDNPEMALIPIALLIGKAIKESKVNDKFIPLIVVVLSTVIGFVLTGFDSVAAIKGFVAGMIAVAGFTAVKQLLKGKEDQDEVVEATALLESIPVETDPRVIEAVTGLQENLNVQSQKLEELLVEVRAKKRPSRAKPKPEEEVQV